MNDHQAVKAWQDSERVHPLTCRRESGHGALEVKDAGAGPYLECAECGYVQTYVPEVVLLAPRMVERGEITEEQMAGANLAFFLQDAPKEES